ncbi:hypothetical protein SEPCBS57363_006110 [Sporothrix epigloea]|uniref:Uncharacterized protein n=1 Tax=Sporothrix epigloea TaxID=1892477 RepID=A0ABP0E5E5_9PEZI
MSNADGLRPQDSLVSSGPEHDEEERAADARLPLLRGLECPVTIPGTTAGEDAVAADLFDAGEDEHDSLFGGADDADMESLFGADACDKEPSATTPSWPTQQQNQSPLALFPSCPLDLPFPLLLPDMSERAVDVSTLFPGDMNEQQQQQQQQNTAAEQQEEQVQQEEQEQQDFGLDMDLSLPDPDFDAMLSLDFQFDFEMDFAPATALEAQGNQTTLSFPELDTPDLCLDTFDCTSPLTTMATTTTIALAPVDAAAGDYGQYNSLSPLLQLQAPPAQGIDTLFHTTGLGTPDDQEGHGRSAHNGSGSHDNTSNGDNSDDDVVILSSRQLTPGFVLTPPALPALPPLPAQEPPAASIPHYLELRPRCPQGPPPARIDLSHNVQELLPHVQLHSKLSLRGIQELLGLDTDAGRYLITTCQRHLADPVHTVTTSGSSDPIALRVLKITLIMSSLALLVDGNVGQHWFGPDSPLEPKSMHVWPDDSTTLTLLFIQLLYRLTRNNNARDRHRKRSAAAAASKAVSSRSTSVTGKRGQLSHVSSPTPPPQPDLLTPAASPTFSNTKVAQPRKRRRKSKESASSAMIPSLPLPTPGPPRPLFTYSSPRVIRDNLLLGTDPGSNGALLGSKAGSGCVELAEPCATFPPPSITVADTCPARPPPFDAVLRYRINLVDRVSQERTIPQIVLFHSGAVRDEGYSYIVEMCTQRGQIVDSVSIVTMLGLERVNSNNSWDRVVGRTYDQLLMDGEVRVLVCIQ